MNYPWLEKYFLAKASVNSDYKIKWGWQRYMAGGKMSGAVMHPSDKYAPEYAEKDLLNLKCDLIFSEPLRAEHHEIMPGFPLTSVPGFPLIWAANCPTSFLKNS